MGKHYEGFFISERVPDFVLLFCIWGIVIVTFFANIICWPLLNTFVSSVLLFFSSSSFIKFFLTVFEGCNFCCFGSGFFWRGLSHLFLWRVI